MVALGATLAWATYCDPYYGVYCVVLGVWHLGARAVALRLVEPDAPASRWWHGAVDAWLVLSVVVTLGIAVTGGGTMTIGPIRLGLQTVYTPMLSVTMAAVVKFLLWYRPVAQWQPTAGFRTLFTLAPYGVAASVLLLSPLLVTMVRRALAGRFVTAPVLWRNSTPGVDLLSFVVPNPNHPLVYPWLNGWLTAQDGGFVENVASIPFVALAVLVVAGLAWKNRSSWYWFGLAAVTASFALGPFVRVAGFNLFIPTPWALARYVPLLGEARAPARFTVVVMLAVGVLFALSLRAIAHRYPRRRRAIVGAAALGLILELLPAPRPLYPAEHNAVYDIIKADPRNVRVLELPFGVRDGLSSFGNFNSSAQFNQTRHEKRLIGGYLSRVSPRRVEAIRRFPVLSALMVLSEGAPLPADLDAAAQERTTRFINDARVGYVVIATRRASPELVAFAIRTLDLEFVADEGIRTLYRPRQSTSLTWLTGNDLPLSSR